MVRRVVSRLTCLCCSARRLLCRHIIVLALLAVASSSAAADLAVAGIFRDGMVLQRETLAPVWGTADPGATVTVSFAGQTKQAKATAGGKWQIKLDPLTASSEPAVLKISANFQSSVFTLHISNVLVGEVWLVGGQSNVDWTLKKLVAKPGSPEEAEAYHYLLNEVAAADDSLLRQFTVGTSASPLKELEEIRANTGWTRAVKGQVADFSGTGYFFGRELRKGLGVPVGLIDANRGGTDIEPWIPKREYMKTDGGKAFFEQETGKLAPEAMKQHKAAYQKQLAAWKQQAAEAKAAKKKAPRKPADPLNANRVPAALYNAFIHPLASYAMKGVVWYQGENNTAYRTEQYRQSMLWLIAGWRNHWRQEEMPFIWCQLANKNHPNTEPNDGDSWVSVQNQQREVLALTENTGMAVLNDIGDARNIHPKNKVDAGKRLAVWAFKKAYRKEIVCSGPLYKSAQVQGSKIVIRFDHVGSGLMAGKKIGLEPTQEVDEPLKRFQICGADRQWQWAEARITDKNTVDVWHKEIPEPTEVRYAWSANPAGANLYNKEGLPASLFKTGALQVIE